MDSCDIQFWLERLIRPDKCRFLGVFARNFAPQPETLPSYPCCFVSNTDIATLPGSHWVAFYYVSAFHCEFFDSFGLAPSTYGFHLNSDDLQVITSSQCVQSTTSAVCGQFCIYFLYTRSEGHPFSRIISSFSNIDLTSNDNAVAKFFKKLTPHIPPRDFYRSLYTPYPAHHSSCPSYQTCCSRSSSHI